MPLNCGGEKKSVTEGNILSVCHVSCCMCESMCVCDFVFVFAGAACAQEMMRNRNLSKLVNNKAHNHRKANVHSKSRENKAIFLATCKHFRQLSIPFHHLANPQHIIQVYLQIIKRPRHCESFFY